MSLESGLRCRPLGEEFTVGGVRLRVVAEGSLSTHSPEGTPVCCHGCYLNDECSALCVEEPWYSGLGQCGSHCRADGVGVIFQRVE